MKVMMRSGFAGLAAVLAAMTLTGCSGEYPDGGKMDLSMIQKQAKVIDVEGNVYGLKNGGVDLVSAFMADREAYYGYGDLVVEALKAGQEPPQFTLTYPNVSPEVMAGFAEDTIAEAKRFIASDDRYFSGSDEAGEMFRNYRQAIEDDIITHIEPTAALEMDGEDVVFDGVGDGYDALLLFGEIVVETKQGSGRDSVKTLEFADLSLESVKNADQIVIPFTRKGARAAERETEDMEDSGFTDELIERIEDMIEDRA